MPGLSPETVVARSGDPLTAPVEQELAMLDPRQGRYFGLDRIGHRIWQLLEQPRSVESLCAALEDEFDVDRDTCRADVVTFLQQLEQAELLETR